MKGVAAVAVIALLTVGTTDLVRGSTAAAHPGPAKHKKKCKGNWVFKKGKCRRVKRPHHLPPFDNSPRDIIRATVTWQGNANVDLIIEDLEDHLAGYSSAAGGVVNEIPAATHLGDVGLGGGTETFIDHAWHPLYPDFVPNRSFLFGACAREVLEPVTATLTFVTNIGGPTTLNQHFEPEGSGATNLCALYYG